MRYLAMVVVIIGLAAALPAKAEIPTVLTDKVRQGDGLINIMTDVSGEELTSYLEGGTLYLGVDVNEDASGLESSISSGVAIKEMELISPCSDCSLWASSRCFTATCAESRTNFDGDVGPASAGWVSQPCS